MTIRYARDVYASAMRSLRTQVPAELRAASGGNYYPPAALDQVEAYVRELETTLLESLATTIRYWGDGDE